MKERIKEFLIDYLCVFAICIKAVLLWAVCIVPIILGFFVSPWWFIGAVITVPIPVTFMVRM